MSDIYEQHAKAFSNVSAYVILKNDILVGRIAFKFPKDGAGRLTVFLHFLGQEMVKGMASGYGYDKKTAAMVNAMKKVKELPWQCDTMPVMLDNGQDWDVLLREQGFSILQAV